jgi:predicted transcriptional regulator
VVDEISIQVREKYGESVELFIHTDGCLDFSCRICEKRSCPERKQEFVRRVPWTIENVVNNSKHRI